MQNLKELRYDQSPSGPFVWLMDSLMGAVEVCVHKDPSLTEIERAVGLQITAVRDTQEALKMLKQRRITKREKVAIPLLKAYLGMIKGNTLSRTWEKGLAKQHKVQHKMDKLGKVTTRFLQALNLVSHPKTPITAIARTVGKFKNNVEDLH